MLVEKGGISRNINEKRLYEYKAKGFVVAEKPTPPPPPAKASTKDKKE